MTGRWVEDGSRKSDKKAVNGREYATEGENVKCKNINYHELTVN